MTCNCNRPGCDVIDLGSRALIEKLRTQLLRDHDADCAAALRGEVCDCGHTMTPAEVFEDIQLQAELDAMSDEEIEAQLLESGVDKETLDAGWKRTERFVGGLIKLRKDVLARDARIVELEARTAGLETAVRLLQDLVPQAYEYQQGCWPEAEAALNAADAALGTAKP